MRNPLLHVGTDMFMAIEHRAIQRNCAVECLIDARTKLNKVVVPPDVAYELKFVDEQISNALNCLVANP